MESSSTCFAVLLAIFLLSSCKKGKPTDDGNPGNGGQPGADATFFQVSTSENNTMAIDTKMCSGQRATTVAQF